MTAVTGGTGASSQEVRSLAHGVVGSARVIAFGTSNVAPAGAVVAGLVIVVSYAGFASPLVVLIAFVASLCCASTIAEFARRLPSAGSLYTYNSRGLGRTGGFLAGWMMIFAYAHYSAAVFSPASSPHGQFTDIINAMICGISAFAGFETAAALGEEARNTRRSIPASTIGVVIVTGIFYLLVVVAEIFAAGHHGISGFMRQSTPLGYLTSRYWSPSVLWTIDLVIVLTGLGFAITGFNAAIRIMFAMGRERVLPRPLARLSSRQTPVVSIGCVTVFTLALGLPLTYAYGAHAFAYLIGAAALSIVLIYLAVNIAAIRAFRTEFRGEFTLWRHLLVPAAGAVLFLFPLWGILHPRAHTLVDLLPFAALGWLCLGAVIAGVLRARQPASFETLGRVFMPGEG